MTQIREIKKIFKDIIKTKRLSVVRKEFNVDRVWVALLLSFIFVNVGLVVLNTYLFFQINKGEIFIVKQETTALVDTIDRTLLRETIDSYESLLIEFNTLKEEKINITDPSI